MQGRLRLLMTGRSEAVVFLEKQMTQDEIENLVEIMGEEVCVINQYGFDLFNPFDSDFDPEPDDRPPMVFDWDQTDIESLEVLTHPRR